MDDSFKLPPLQMPRNVIRPPKNTKGPSALPTGPRRYRQTSKSTIRIGGPGIAPPEFLRASTSASEWMFYWASKRVLDPDQDPRQPPFEGGRLWTYQSAQLGNFTRQKGSAVVDFLYMLSYPYLAVRLQTYRFHLAVDAFKQASDMQQLIALYGKFDVVDVYEGDFIGDLTGQAAIIQVKKAIGLIKTQNPITSGGVVLVRNKLGR